MTTPTDHDLSNDQWEALKALRLSTPAARAANRFVIDSLIALEFATISDGRAVLTQHGRKALVRGSARLWDLAA